MNIKRENNPPSFAPQFDDAAAFLKIGTELHKGAVARRSAGEDILLLTYAEQRKPPQETIEACVAAISDDAPAPEASRRLHRAMAAASTKNLSMNVMDNEVLAVAGGQFGLYDALQAITDPGSHAIVFAPYYQTYLETLQVLGFEISIVDTRSENGFEPEGQALRNALRPNTRLVLINTPNIPTGAAYSSGSLQAIAEVCEERDLWLVSDEVYSSLTQIHISPRSLPGMEKRTIVINSLSKSHGIPSWHIGWITAPAALISRISKFRAITGEIAAPLQSAAATALETDYGVSDIIRRHIEQRDFVLSGLRSARGLKIRGNAASEYTIVDVREVEPDCRIFTRELLDKAGVAVMPGLCFGQAAGGHIRISLGQSTETLREGIERLCRFAAEYNRSEAIDAKR